MNYMRELNAFRDWSMLNSPATGEVALWHSLMSINNAAGWANWFTTANQTLQLMTGLSRQGLDKARNRLVQRDRIEYRKGISNQAGKYHMVSFECQIVGTAGVTEVGAVGAFQWSQQERSGSHTGSTLKDLDKDNTKHVVIPVHVGEVNQCFEQAFGRLPNDVQRERFCYFVDKGLEVDLVKQSMMTARTNGANVSYALKILERQLDSGIHTVAQAEAQEAERQVSASVTSPGQKRPRDVAAKKDDRYSNFYELFPNT